jgi:hypothetical protein
MQAVVFLKAFLYGIERTTFGGKAFYRGDAFAIGLYRQHGTALNAFAIEQNGAGTAAAGIAANMGAGHIQYFANEVYQQKAGFHLGSMLGTIHGYGY